MMFAILFLIALWILALIALWIVVPGLFNRRNHEEREMAEPVKNSTDATKSTAQVRDSAPRPEAQQARPMDIPAFAEYYPDESMMDAQQRHFYRWLEAQLKRGNCPDIAGNISYVFVFVYKLIASVKGRGFESLHEYLIHLAEGYAHEPKLATACRYWAYDCLLGQKRYELYLEKTEPPTPLGIATHPSNLRLNIQEHCGLKANPIDILRLFGGRKSKFARENVGLYRDCIITVFDEVAAAEGDWFGIMLPQVTEPDRRYPCPLFQGVNLPWEFAPLEFDLRLFYCAAPLPTRIKDLAKEAENRTRKTVGVPNVGEGWISETALFRKLQEQFRQTIVIHHGQPPWLGRQHFDVWFPDWNIAVEFHGEQHFQPVDFFGGAEAFAENVKRDARKANLAHRQGVKLLVVTKDDDAAVTIGEIQKILRERGAPLPPGAG
jgi:hypothetical protein